MGQTRESNTLIDLEDLDIFPTDREKSNELASLRERLAQVEKRLHALEVAIRNGA